MGVGSSEMETVNIDGSTEHYNGSVGTTPIDIPSVAAQIIQFVLIDNVNNSNKDVLVSFDGGTNYKTVRRGAVLSWTLKGCLTQIKIKGSTSGVNYEILMNRET